MPHRVGAPWLRLWLRLWLLPLLAWRVREDDGELALPADYKCRYLELMDIMRSSEPACFCYLPSGYLHLKNIWTTIQVNMNNIEPVEVVSISEECNCHQSENLFAFLKCLLNNLWQPKVSKETIMSVTYYGDKTCVRVQPTNKMPYTVSVQQNMSDEKLPLLFVAVGLLFHFACNLSRKATRFFRSEKIKIRYLTEEEFREQGETETARALEELRRFCSRPEFPSWEVMVKLQNPQKFANVVLGLPHVLPKEVTAHNELYGLCGAILEEQLFNTENKTELDRPIGLTEAEENHEEFRKQL